MRSKKHTGNALMLVKAWGITGGWAKNSRSLDFWLAVTVWIVCIEFWSHGAWWDQVINVIPNLLGFTLGGFAIFLGFGSDAFRGVISDRDENQSPYISVSAAFLVFVSMEIAALLFAFGAKAVHFPTPEWLASWKQSMAIGDFIFSGFGYFIFIYSITLSFRSAMRIFRLSRWYHEFVLNEQEREDAEKKALDVEI